MNNQRLPKVWVTQEMPNLNYLPAEEFGDVDFVSKVDFSPMQNTSINEDVASRISARLQDFNPEQDYVVTSGSPTLMAAVFMFLGRRHRSVKILRWSNRDSAYTPVTVRI